MSGSICPSCGEDIKVRKSQFLCKACGAKGAICVSFATDPFPIAIDDLTESEKLLCEHKRRRPLRSRWDYL